MSIYCTYLTTYSGNKLPPFYIGYSTVDKVLNKNYHGTPTSKRYSKTFKQEEIDNPHLFKTKIITVHETRGSAHKKESYFLCFFNVKKNPMFINLDNADGKFYKENDYKHSNETKEYLRKINLGSGNPMFGKKQSKETLEKRFGPNTKVWWRLGIKHPRFGKKESKENLKIRSNKIARTYKVTHPNGEQEIVKNLNQFIKKYNLAQSIYSSKKCKGFIIEKL